MISENCRGTPSLSLSLFRKENDEHSTYTSQLFDWDDQFSEYIERERERERETPGDNKASI